MTSFEKSVSDSSFHSPQLPKSAVLGLPPKGLSKFAYCKGDAPHQESSIEKKRLSDV